MTSIDSWPSLRYENWNDTIDSLHMKLQIIGKVKDIGSKAAKWDIESLKAEIPV
jgi:hypothetical protein